ncbi:MAG: tetratricopeptide repeat protein [Bradymonadia bacterium]
MLWPVLSWGQDRPEVPLTESLTATVIAPDVLGPVLGPAGAGKGDLAVTGFTFGPHNGRGSRNFWAKVQIDRPGTEAKVLYVDPGLALLGPKGAVFVPVPHQRSLLILPSQVTNIELLPLYPDRPLPPEGAPLQAARVMDQGVMALLSLVVRIEGDDIKQLKRYVSEQGGVPEVDTIVDNRDVELARWMRWDRSPTGELRGRLSRDAIRFALHALTAGITIQEMCDWLRVNRKLDLNPGAEQAWRVSRPVEYLLERSGMNYRVFSPRYADFHYNQGIKAFLAKDLPDAEKHFKAAVGLKSDFADAQYNLGVVYYRQGDFKRSQAAFLVASGMSAPTADVFYNRGAALFRLGDKLAAARAFREALKLSPNHALASDWLKKADPEGKTAPKKPKRRKRRRRRRR